MLCHLDIRKDLLDYAMRKERLLLDMNKNMDTKTLTTLIAAGLPGFIMDKIDREKCEDSTKLFNEIRRYESLMNKKNFPKKKEEKFENKRKTGEKTPCKNCESLSKGIRYHPEKSCWFKKKENSKPSVVGNNSVIEVELNTEKKN